MGWTERQQAMLAEMGIRVWQPASPALGDGPAEPLAPVGAARSVDPRAGQRPEQRPGQPADRSADPALPVRAAAPVVSPGPRADAIRRMDWPALREAVATCAACSLCDSRTQTVFGVGHPQAQWMVVGEAPGEQEDLAGEPFVGKSGQLLDNMLRAIGLSRGEAEAGSDAAPAPASAPGGAVRQVYIANVLKCRPPGNRNPKPEELAQCEPFLIRQIELVRPRIILAMGRFAVQSLLRSAEPIGKLRGRVHHYQGVPVVVTYHPAYLLRNPEDKSRAWEDLCLALETAAGAPHDDPTHSPDAR